MILAAVGAALLFASCSSSKGTTSSSIIQKRKYRKGWHLDLPTRNDDRAARSATPRAVEHQGEALSAPAPTTYEPTASATTVRTETDAAPILIQDPPDTRSAQPRARLQWSKARKPARLDASADAGVTAALYPQERSRKAAPEAVPSPEGSGRTNTMAIIGFVCSLIIPLLGLIFSIIALGQIKRTGERGYGWAMAGLIISILSILIVIAILA